MSEKGGISLPLVLVVTIIMIAIVIAFAYIFIFNTKTELEGAFGDLTTSAGEFGCSLAGPLSGSVCPT